MRPKKESISKAVIFELGLEEWVEFGKSDRILSEENIT